MEAMCGKYIRTTAGMETGFPWMNTHTNLKNKMPVFRLPFQGLPPQGNTAPAKPWLRRNTGKGLSPIFSTFTPIFSPHTITHHHQLPTLLLTSTAAVATTSLLMNKLGKPCIFIDNSGHRLTIGKSECDTSFCCVFKCCQAQLLQFKELYMRWGGRSQLSTLNRN